MSILNVNKIQPVGSGQTVTISAANIDTGSSTFNVGAGKSIRLYGATSGYSEIVAAAGSASTTFTLPANGGSASQYLQTDGSGVLSWAGAGKILQVVTTPYTGQFSTSAANTYEQITGLNCSITTSSASSKVFVMVTLGQMSTNGNATASYSVTRDGTRILQGAVDCVRGTCSFKYCCPSSSHSDGTTFTGVDTPGAAGTYVYGVQAVAQGGTTNYVNRTQVNSNLTDSYEFRASSHITLMEISS
jgi:hypothetical protein